MTRRDNSLHLGGDGNTAQRFPPPDLLDIQPLAALQAFH